MPQFPTQVLLVEDSLVAIAILKRFLASSLEVKVVGTACNGKEALELIPKVQPAVICTDLHMQGMDGLEFIKQVMAKYPRPILVISNSVQEEDTHNIFQLLEAGAVDVFPKPSSGAASDYELAKRELIDKIKILSGVTVFTKQQQLPPFATSTFPSSPSSLSSLSSLSSPSPIKVVVHKHCPSFLVNCRLTSQCL